MNQRTLSAGGASPFLPENWKAPYGYMGGPVIGALWVGISEVTPDDLRALTSLEGSPDPNTIAGVLSPDWNAKQYADVDRDDLDPWETFPCPGGLGSAAYKFQYLPSGVSIAHPRWNILRLDGNGARAEGGEPITRVHVGHGHWERQVVDITVSFDPERQLWAVLV